MLVNKNVLLATVVFASRNLQQLETRTLTKGVVLHYSLYSEQRLQSKF